MNIRKNSSYRPYSRNKSLLGSILLSVGFASIAYLLAPNEPKIALYVFICVFLFMLLGVSSMKYEPFAINTDQFNPRSDKLELTDYGLCLKKNELTLGEFFYKDIKRIVPTETDLVILPMRPDLMQYWLISYDYLTKSNLNPDQIYAKLSSKGVAVANPSPSSLSSPSGSSVNSRLSRIPVSDLKQPNNTLNKFRFYLVLILIFIILFTIYKDLNSHKKVLEKRNVTSQQTQNT